jgi:membrane protein
MLNDNVKRNLRSQAQVRYRHINQLSQGNLVILVDAFNRFKAVHAAEAAASIAYYALFSLFPLLFFLVAIGTSVLKNPQVQLQVQTFITEALPTAKDLVQQNMNHMLEIRGAVGVLGMLGLIWTTTAVFTALVHNINRAWPEAGSRTFIKGRLIALVLAGVMIVSLLVLSLFFTTVFNLLPQLSIPILGDVSFYRTLVWRVFSRLIPWLLMYAMFLLLYWWVPNTEVRWSEANWGALLATSAWELNRAGFVWYLNSGLARYQLVYGSLGAVVALMLWIYLSSLITLFGAHLSAAVARHRRIKLENHRSARYQTYIKSVK